MLSDRYGRRRLVTFIALVGLCLALLVVSSSAPVHELRRGVNFAISPLQDTLSDGTRSVTEVFGALAEIGTLKRQNQELQATVEQLEDEVATLEAVREENRRLTKLLKTQDRIDHETIAARVTSLHATQFERVITLDSGSEAGITVGAPVLSDGGALAGQVDDVGEGWASVLLINDTRSLITGLDSRTRTTGEVTGRLEQPLAMMKIRVTDKIEVSDRIVTAGIDLGKRFRSYFPKNLVIGRVIDVEEQPGDVVKTALVQPEADLDHLERVLVITDFTPPKGRGSSSASSGGEDGEE